MRIDRWVEYTPLCDRCARRGRDFGDRYGNEVDGYVLETTRKAAEKRARETGWKVRRGETLCPRCLKGDRP